MAKVTFNDHHEYFLYMETGTKYIRQKRLIVENIAIRQRIQEADYFNDIGNWQARHKNWLVAKDCFTSAIRTNPNEAIYYANRSLCGIHITRKIETHILQAQKDALRALELDQNCIEAIQQLVIIRIVLQQPFSILPLLTTVLDFNIGSKYLPHIFSHLKVLKRVAMEQIGALFENRDHSKVLVRTPSLNMLIGDDNLARTLASAIKQMMTLDTEEDLDVNNPKFEKYVSRTIKKLKPLVKALKTVPTVNVT